MQYGFNTSESPRPGYADPVIESQKAYRRILEAMAHPGTSVRVGVDLQPPKPLNRATAGICLSLFDYDTNVWLDCAHSPEVVEWLRFHCGCPITQIPEQADFALFCNGIDLTVLEKCKRGQDEYPENSATLILQVPGLQTGAGKSLTGPGIESASYLSIHLLTEEFWEFWDRNHGLFPLGLDVLFTFDTVLAALPRSVKAGA